MMINDHDSSEAPHSSTNGQGPVEDEDHPYHLDFDHCDHFYDHVVLQSPRYHHHHNKVDRICGDLGDYVGHDNHDIDHDHAFDIDHQSQLHHDPHVNKAG